MSDDTLRPEELLARQVLAGEAAGASAECPEPELVARLALDELGGDELATVRSHLLTCDACSLTADSIREADIETPPGFRSLRDTVAQALRALVTFEMPVIEPVGALRGAAKKDHGLELYAAGDYEAAVIELESSVSARRPDLLHVLGACHLRAGRARAAIDSLTRAVKGLPHSADTHWLLAQAHLLNDDPESATKSLKKVEKLGGDLGEAAATLQEQLAKLLES